MKAVPSAITAKIVKGVMLANKKMLEENARAGTSIVFEENGKIVRRKVSLTKKKKKAKKK
jgi:hypothetical protein